MSNHRVEVGPFAFNFKDVLLPMGLTVANVDIRGDGGTLDSSPFALNLARPGSMEATVTESALMAFLQDKDLGGMHSISISAEGGKLHVKAKKTVLVDLKITAVASLRIVDGSQLWIDIESVDVMGAGAKNLVQSQLAKVNPVLDTKDLPIQATMTEIVIGDGVVILRGTVAPP